MDAGDAWRCKLKILYENSWVPQKCGNKNRYHKYHNVVLSVVLDDLFDAIQKYV